MSYKQVFRGCIIMFVSHTLCLIEFFRYLQSEDGLFHFNQSSFHHIIVLHRNSSNDYQRLHTGIFMQHINVKLTFSA